MLRYPLVALLVVASVLRTGAFDIILTDGRTFTAARIVAVGDKQVSIVHSRGMTGVSPDLVPLDVLARAHMALEANAVEKKRAEAVALAKASQRIASEKSKHDEEIQIRLALAAAREGRELPAATKSPVDRDAILLALKAKFPLKRREKAGVWVTNTRAGKRRDTIEIEVPDTGCWTYYRGMVKRPRSRLFRRH